MKIKNKIPVSFAMYEQFEDYPVWENHVGHVSFDRVNEFLQTVANTPRNPNGCIDYIFASYSNTVSAMRGENAFKSCDNQKQYDVFSGEIKLSGFFDDDYNQNNDITRCPMCVQHTNRKRSEQNKMHTCANMIKSGKCVDPFMRKLAAMMYPDKYTKKR